MWRHAVGPVLFFTSQKFRQLLVEVEDGIRIPVKEIQGIRFLSKPLQGK